MKKSVLASFLFLSACQATYQAPADFKYEEHQTSFFKIAAWQKITDKNAPYKIYIEGDGFAFNAHGYPTTNPTPQSTFLRQIAFNDPAANVVYLARPCQYVTDSNCEKKYWTTARFAPEVISSEADAVRQIAEKNDVVLVGFSGGAQVAGLLAVLNKDIKTKKLITISGNLDHQTWTESLNLKPLNESLSLTDYKQQFLSLPQIHYVGASDTTVPPKITKDFIGSAAPIVEVQNATHNKGFESIYQQIYTQD